MFNKLKSFVLNAVITLIFSIFSISYSVEDFSNPRDNQKLSIGSATVLRELSPTNEEQFSKMNLLTSSYLSGMSYYLIPQFIRGGIRLSGYPEIADIAAIFAQGLVMADKELSYVPPLVGMLVKSGTKFLGLPDQISSIMGNTAAVLAIVSESVLLNSEEGLDEIEQGFNKTVNYSIAFIGSCVGGIVAAQIESWVYKILAQEQEGPLIPPISRGNEEIYRKFLGGVLIYRPNKGSDIGRLNLPIANLYNPLEGEFDLSCCGEVGVNLSISTGYRKRINPTNTRKVEIWISPRFLIERDINTTASHFNPIMSDWSPQFPIGLFWTWGNWDNMSWYDYQTNRSINEISQHDLYENWSMANRNSCSLMSITGNLANRLVMSKYSSQFTIWFK